MSITNRIRTVFYDNAGQVADKTFDYVGGAQVKLDENCPQSATTELIAAIDVSELLALMILSDKDATLETNDAGTPDATIALVGGIPVMWSADIGGSNPLGATDVTSLFVTLGAVGTARVQVVALLDATP